MEKSVCPPGEPRGGSRNSSGEGEGPRKGKYFQIDKPPPQKKKIPPPRSAAAYMQCTRHCWLDLSACLLSRMPAIYYFGPTLIVS